MCSSVCRSWVHALLRFEYAIIFLFVLGGCDAGWESSGDGFCWCVLSSIALIGWGMVGLGHAASGLTALLVDAFCGPIRGFVAFTLVGLTAIPCGAWLCDEFGYGVCALGVTYLAVLAG